MRKWLPLLAISLGSFMLMIDATIVNVALPDMAADLATSFGSLQWVVDAYALALAALLIGMGAVADNRGHRRTFLAGLVLFVVASVACGLASGPATLIAARCVQGAGGAAMFATTFALINASYTGRDRGTAYGVFSAISGGAAALGPVVGGLLTQGVSWRWIFFVNVPAGLVTVVLTLLSISHARPGRGRRVDVAGIAAFTVAATAATFALIRSATDGWGTVSVVALLVVAVLGVLAFLAAEARSRTPLVELSLFRNPAFSATTLAAMVLTFSAYGVLVYSTVWTQTLLGLTPVEAGAVALPLPVLVAILSPVTGRLMHRLPRSLTIGGGVALIGLGGLLTALLVTPRTGWFALLPGLALMGIGIGFASPALSRTATEAVGDDRSGMASGAINTARQLGQAFGLALLGSFAATQTAATLDAAGVTDPATAATAILGGEARPVITAPPGVDLTDVVHAGFAAGLDLAYTVAGATAVVLGVLIAGMLRRRSATTPDGRRVPVLAGTPGLGSATGSPSRS